MIPKTTFDRVWIGVGLLFLFACSGPKYTQENWPDDRLTFGNGGGFTGVVKEYVLLENGQLFARTGVDAPWNEMTKVKKKAAKAAFTEMRNLELEDKKVDRPGNIYYFLQFTNGQGEYQLTWGEQNYKVDGQVKELYQTLQAFTTTK